MDEVLKIWPTFINLSDCYIVTRKHNCYSAESAYDDPLQIGRRLSVSRRAD
jgi:hypothetical protein